MSNRLRLRNPGHIVRWWTISELERGGVEKIVGEKVPLAEVNQTLLALRREGFEIVTRDGMFIADHPEVTIYVRPA